MLQDKIKKKLKEKEKKDPSPPELASQICDLIMR
jgi:hypothetical protein